MFILKVNVEMDRCASVYAIHPSKDPWTLTKNELESFPKYFLIKHYSKFITLLWDRLPEHLQCDSEIQSYHKCNDHFNPPWELTHVDAIGPIRRDCEKCHIMGELVDIYAIRREKNPREITAEELRIISPTVFKKYFHQFTDILWDRLPEYYKSDNEIISYRRCTQHWKTTGDHIDGPMPQRRNCRECCKSLKHIYTCSGCGHPQ